MVAVFAQFILPLNVVKPIVVTFFETMRPTEPSFNDAIFTFQYYQQHLMKSNQNKFQEIISNSVLKVRTNFSSPQRKQFQDTLEKMPKKIKQFNAGPYMFIFTTLLGKKELVQYTLKNFQVMLQQNYITSQLYDTLADTIRQYVPDYYHTILHLIEQIKEPNLKIFDLFFEIHSTIPLPDDYLRKLKSVGYSWLVRAFSFTRRPMPTLPAIFYHKIVPEEMPELILQEESQQRIANYISKVVQQMVTIVQHNIEKKGVKGKYGFCFICKSTADYYCKDTKIPVCKVNCKKEHLSLLSQTNALNYQYSQEFRSQIEDKLINNIIIHKSPSLSIDFLCSIYLHSSYIPQVPLNHRAVLETPVIYERICLLYSSYYGQKQEMFQHIFAYCLQYNNQYVKNLAAQYFLKISQTERLFDFYWNYDLKGTKKIFTYVLLNMEQTKKIQFIQHSVKTIHQNFKQRKITYQNKNRSLLRSINYQKQLPYHLFDKENPQQIIRFIIKNQCEVNKDKLVQILMKDEDLCIKFLTILVQPYKESQIDELLRQVFYFINIKVSDKIYHLLQLLCKVHIPQQLFNELQFFQYCYLILMFITEIHHPDLVEKPTIQNIKLRIEKIHPQLIEKHPQYIERMFKRISAYPFSRISRGILQRYQRVPNLKIDKLQFEPEMILIDNWQIVYETLMNYRADLKLIYKICTILSSDTTLCQAFLQMMINRLSQKGKKDDFLIPAINNIIQEQPNAVGHMWKSVFEDIVEKRIEKNKIRKQKKQLNPTAQSSGSVDIKQHTFDLGILISLSNKLTQDNFFYFTKYLSSYFTLTQDLKYFLQLIKLNSERMKLISQLLISAYERTTNSYIQLQFIKQLQSSLQQSPSEQCCRFLIHMIKLFEITPITECLFVEAVVQFQFDALPLANQIWSVVSHKCLQIKQSRGMVVQLMMRDSKSCECYESYIIQKTLNSNESEPVSQEILVNLTKLEPYINQMNPQVLRMFILRQNVQTIINNFEYFCSFQATYEVLIRELEIDNHSIKNEIFTTLIEKVDNLMLQRWIDEQEQEMLKIQNFPTFLIHLYQQSQQQCQKILKRYISKLSFKTTQIQNINKQYKYIFLKLEQTSLLMTELSQFLKRYNQCINVNQPQQYLNELVRQIQGLHMFLSKFEDNCELKIELKKYLKTKMVINHLPSALNSMVQCCKFVTLSRIYFIRESSQFALSFAMVELSKIIEQQKQINKLYHQAKIKNNSQQNPQKIMFIEFHKKAKRYKQIYIQFLNAMLQNQYQLNKQHLTQSKKLLFSIMLNGYFNQQTFSFSVWTQTENGIQIIQILQKLNK